MSEQSIFPITPVDVTPAPGAGWVEVDVSAHVPAGATGIIFHAVNSTLMSTDFGVRKKGSTDDLYATWGSKEHVWGMIGVDANGKCELYDSNNVVTLYLVGYFNNLATFFDNITTVPVPNPNYAYIWARHSGWVGFGTKLKRYDAGPTDDVIGYITTGVALRCQLCLLTTYATDWTDYDLSSLVTGANMAFIYCSINEHGYRKDGSAENIYLDPDLPGPQGVYAIIELVPSQVLEVKWHSGVNSAQLDAAALGIFEPDCTTDAATEKTGPSGQPGPVGSARLNGTLVCDGGDVDATQPAACGFEWGPAPRNPFDPPVYGFTTPTEDKTRGQTFSQVITGLCPGVKYDCRAFATNAWGTEYGAKHQFTMPSVAVTTTSTIKNSDSSAAVDADGGWGEAGGLLGKNNEGIIQQCHASGNITVTPQGDSGGLVGEMVTGTIDTCYATGNITSTGTNADRIGGLVGRFTAGIMKDSYSTGVVTGGDDYVGGCIGALYAGEITDCYATGNVNGDDYLGGVVGYIYASGVTKLLRCYYQTGTVSGDRQLGGFAGQAAANADIQDCWTEGLVDGNFEVGGFFGVLYDVITVVDCHSGATVNAGQSAGGFIGGLYANLGSIGNSLYASGPVNGFIAIGGFVGWLHNGYTITGCYATGNVTGYEAVGGFAGVNAGTIKRSFARGDAEGPEPNAAWGAGGFVGYNFEPDGQGGAIENCYARGSANGDWGIGGFAGSNGNVNPLDETPPPLTPGNIDKGYSTGAPTGNTAVGGFCGSNGGTISNSFWDTETSGTGTSDGGTGKTTAEMKTQTTFTDAGWDFEAIWAIVPTCNDSYPCLLGITPSCILAPAIPFRINKAYALSREEL